MSEEIIQTESLSESLAEADRAYRDAEKAVDAAWAEISEATNAHRRVGAKWAAAVRLKNELEERRAAILEKIRKEGQ